MLGRGIGKGYNFCFEGNSFMYGTSAIATKTVTYLGATSLRWEHNILAVGGSAIGYPLGSNNYMMYTNRTNAVTNWYHSSCRRNVLICHEGINDLNFYLDPAFGNQSAATAATSCYDNYVSYYGALVGKASIGYKCIFNTITPRNDAAATAAYETARQNASNKFDTATLNGKLRTDFNVSTAYPRIFTSNLSKWSGCVLYDIGDDPNYGQAGQWANTTYYDSDKIHPTSVMGQSIVDNYISKAIILVTSELV